MSDSVKMDYEDSKRGKVLERATELLESGPNQSARALKKRATLKNVTRGSTTAQNGSVWQRYSASCHTDVIELKTEETITLLVFAGRQTGKNFRHSHGSV